MHIIRILRDYLGITQTQLARRAGITQADLSEMESQEPYGNIDKYQRVAEYLGVPIHALVANDGRLVPIAFFDQHAEPIYKAASNYINIANGRDGEEFVLEREKERVSKFSPSLAKLIMPYYKMQKTPGFDILSFNEKAEPIYIEVKNTVSQRRYSVILTQKEQEKAERLLQAGKTYQIHSITNWGKPNQTYTIFDYKELRASARMMPTEYIFMLNPAEKISGITYFRQKAGLSQYELGDALGITKTKVCQYENSYVKCPVKILYRMACLLGATIDELLQEYDYECA